MKVFFNFRILLALILFLQIGCSYTVQEELNNDQYNNSDTSGFDNSSSDNTTNNSSDIEADKDKSTFLQLPYIENFDTDLDTSVWTKSSNIEKSPVPAVTTYNSDYIHEKTSTIMLSYYNSELSRTVNISVPCAVTFSFYPNGNHFSQNFSFYINNEKKGSWNGFGVKQTYTFLLPQAGEYELKWCATSEGYLFPDSIGNEVYLDSVSIAADKTDSVTIYPQAVQTIIQGETVTYTAKALRCDKSVIDGKNLTKNFTATGAGKQTIIMEIDGKTVITTVNVVSTDYLTKPFTYMGNTYNGIDTDSMKGSSENVNQTFPYSDLKESAKLEVTYPTGNTFNTDGFFPLKLNVNNPEMCQFLYVVVAKGTDIIKDYIYRGNPDSIAGELETRIWLRWGKGEYTVKIYDLHRLNWAYETYDRQKHTSPDGKTIYRGDNVLGYGIYTDYPAVIFFVNNTRDEDGTWLYPSNVVQADDFGLMNKAAELTFGLEDVTDKVKAVHDWIVTSKYYDCDSLIQGCRKSQDALAVMEYGMGVCEGYANLASAMLRSLGIQTKYISSQTLQHGWNHVNIGAIENPDWRLLDCTWDDPVGDNLPADYIRWDNCLVEDLKGGKDPHSASDQEESIGRSISIGRGHDDGTESIAY